MRISDWSSDVCSSDLDHASAELDGYVEHGDALYALAFERQEIDTTTTSLGLRADYLYELAWGTFAPQLRLEYQHDLDADSVATLHYAALPLRPIRPEGRRLGKECRSTVNAR